MTEFQIILVFALLALSVVLLFRVYCNYRYTAHDPHERSEWDPTFIDVQNIKPRVDQVRHHHTQSRPPLKEAGFHKTLLELARHTVADFAFFTSRNQDEDAHHNSGRS